MLIFISGGVRSGKSTLGEKLSDELAKGRKYYLATSKAYDKEMVRRINLHKAQRKNKGFTTIEKNSGVGETAVLFNSGDTVMLDCLGTLLANEMFDRESTSEGDGVTSGIFNDIKKINSSTGNLIIISNDVFSDGCRYSDSVIGYIDALASLHKQIVSISDRAIECVSGIPVVHKDCG